MWGNQSYPYSNLGRWKWRCKGNETILSTDILVSNYWGTREQFVQVSPHFQEVSCNIRRFFSKPGRGFTHLFIPICSMYGRCAYIYHKFKVNVGKSSYSIWDSYPLNWKPPMPQQTLRLLLTACRPQRWRHALALLQSSASPAAWNIALGDRILRVVFVGDPLKDEQNT